MLKAWNASTDWNEFAHLPGEEAEALRPFDVMEAWSVWDAEHRYAGLIWLQDPFWP